MSYNPTHAGGAGYVANSDFANTALQQAALTQASLKRLMASGFTQGVPNVARLTGVNVAKRTLAPTRYLQVEAVVAPAADCVAGIDAAIAAIAAFPFQMWSNQIAADREETEGDYIGGMQIDTSVIVTLGAPAVPPALAVAHSELGNDLEQAFGEYYGIAIFPSSGNQSPLVANTPLREFAQNHRLSGPDGYRGVPPVRWSDNFAHIDLLQSPNPVGVVVRPTVTNGTGLNANISLTIACRLRTFAG